MDYQINFNSAESTVMHIDLNSCFATVEQQANPLLRGKPMVVAAYDSPGGCVLAASIEAKKLGIKTGMRVRDGRLLCSSLIVRSPDPAKYRYVHLALRKILSDYTNNLSPKSIDEFVLNFAGFPAYSRGMHNIGLEIKNRIKQEIGEAITVSIGISTNRFLAKTASGLRKPDGLDEINKSNFLDIYSRLKLTDLCGIKTQNSARLNNMGIYTLMDFYNAPVWKLKAAFSSISGYYWYLRLHGYEIDEVEFGRHSFGNSYALPIAFDKKEELTPILCKLVEKTGFRLRKAGYATQGVHLSILFRDYTHWHEGMKLPRAIFTTSDIYQSIYMLLCRCPELKPVKNLAVTCFNLTKNNLLQTELFEDVNKKKSLSESLDQINNRWGNFAVSLGRMAETKEYVKDRIAFGNVTEL